MQQSYIHNLYYASVCIYFFCSCYFNFKVSALPKSIIKTKKGLPNMAALYKKLFVQFIG